MGLETLLKIFIIVVTLSVIGQAAMLVGIYLSVGRLSRQVARVRADVKVMIDPITSNIAEILEGARANIDKFGSNLVTLTEMTRDRAGHLDSLVSEVSDRARLQVLRIDHVIQDTINRIEETTRVVQRNVLVPIQEASALIRGVRSGLEFFFDRRSQHPGTKPAGEEQLFI